MAYFGPFINLRCDHSLIYAELCTQLLRSRLYQVKMFLDLLAWRPLALNAFIRASHCRCFTRKIKCCLTNVFTNVVYVPVLAPQSSTVQEFTNLFCLSLSVRYHLYREFLNYFINAVCLLLVRFCYC